MARRKQAQWERYERIGHGGAHRPGLWLAISPTGSVNLSRDLAQAMGITDSRRGLALYRWPHDGEMVVKLEGVDVKDGDFRVRLTKAGGAHFNSKRIGGWLGLGESRGRKRVFDVSDLEGEFIFEAKTPPATKTA